MVTRRQFILSSAAMAAAPLAMGACSTAALDENYKAAAARTWRHTDGRILDSSLLQLELVRYATLAPSSHNTQCWKFRIEKQAITIMPDYTRRCPAVDPDDHHLFVSLGCAAENLILAALAHGLRGEARLDSDAAVGIRIALEPARADILPLFRALPERQCTRAEFDGKPLTNGELTLLERTGTGEGVRVLLLTEKTALEKVLEYVVAGNTAQMSDPAFVKELKTWIRFNGDEAAETGDGLFTGTTGNPSIPRWVGDLLFGMFFTKKSENDKYAKHVHSSAGIAIFFSESTDRAHWVEVGRCYERFALQATALGIRTAMLNQPVEVPALRPQLAMYLGVGNHRPDLVVRFGRGPGMPQSLRRPVQSVLV